MEDGSLNLRVIGGCGPSCVKDYAKFLTELGIDPDSVTPLPEMRLPDKPKAKQASKRTAAQHG